MNENKHKIINDPVLGFITIPSNLLYDLLQHPYMQRLTRIKQLGLSSTVYPGTNHTRFLHSLGAMHLTHEAILQLRSKGHEITAEEAEATLSAILLHDIGHGPFSHTLENKFIHNTTHEEITLLLLEKLNVQFDNQLQLAIEIFKNNYHKKFLHQLISSQLDMDRLDYLIRDSFFSGVREGSIGAERIIKMLTVENDHLVVENKGIYSVENFLIARRLMYWQVYLHKTAVAAEKMLNNILQRAVALTQKSESLFATPPLDYFLKNTIDREHFFASDEALGKYLQLDDSDILCAIKIWATHTDKVLSTLCTNFINRKLFKVKIKNSAFDFAEIQQLKQHYENFFSISSNEAEYFFSQGPVHSKTYDSSAEGILIQDPNKNKPASELSIVSEILNTNMLSNRTIKHYLCYLNID